MVESELGKGMVFGFTIKTYKEITLQSYFENIEAIFNSIITN